MKHAEKPPQQDKQRNNYEGHQIRSTKFSSHLGSVSGFKDHQHPSPTAKLDHYPAVLKRGAQGFSEADVPERYYGR